MATEVKCADILIVEDNPGDAKLVMMAIRKSDPGKEVLWLEDGEKALNYLMGEGAYSTRNTKNQPQLILLDLTLPKLSGKELLRKLKASKITNKIEIVILTGSQNEADLAESYGFGVKTYIRKQIAAKNCIRFICGEGRENDIEKILSEAYKE